VEIHPSSGLSPVIVTRLWYDTDVPDFQTMTEKLQAHGALAGMERRHDSFTAAYRYGHEIPMGLSARPVDGLFNDLRQRLDAGAEGPKTRTRIGDGLAPGTIAAAAYSGHRHARELGAPERDGGAIHSELPALVEGA
jgi:hypothetical protein